MYVYASYISAYPCLKVRSELPPFNEGEVIVQDCHACMQAFIAQIPP
jgi:hypothetical protein